MQKVKLTEVPQFERRSPTGKFQSFRADVSSALGHDVNSPDASRRHPFDLMQVRIPAGASLCPYHAHSAQWELYIVIAGRGIVRDEDGEHEVGAGDVFVYGPGEAHQISNRDQEELVYQVFTDNPLGETCYYPDSGKWRVNMCKDSKIIKGREVDYFDGEDSAEA